MIDLRLERQILVTDYQASIMNNLVAMALTLSGPRLWILIKRLAIQAYRRLSRSHPRMESHLNHRMDSSPSSLDIIEESHSELSASLRMMTNMVRQLRPRIELPHILESLTVAQSENALLQWVDRAWNILLKHPLDLLVPLILAVIFVGIFVAGASGSVFSAKITSDTVALANSQHCFPPKRGLTRQKAYAKDILYGQQCFHQPSGTEGCGYFFQQDIPFIEKMVKECPWSDDTCDTLYSNFVLIMSFYISAPIVMQICHRVKRSNGD